jgi:hypothetical protein
MSLHAQTRVLLTGERPWDALHGRSPLTPGAVSSWLTPSMYFYNDHRAHSAIGDHPPMSRLVRKNVLARNS